MSTTDHILCTALRMFNERGSHAVTTNALADKLGISVGNLYYHFRNKEEIVRELFERLNEAWRTRLSLDISTRPGWHELEVLISRHFEVLWEYRFFYREQVSLRQRDPVLARRWTLAHQRGRTDMATLITAVIGEGHPRLPPHAIEPSGVLRLGVERLDERGVRSAWPRALLPWESEPGRAAIDTRGWERIGR